MSDSIEKKIDRILFYLESDDTTGHVGIAEQTQINTRDISEIKTNEKVKTRTAVALGGVAGFVVANFGYIIKVIKLIF